MSGQCSKLADWQIYDPRDRTPDASNGGLTEACDEHVGALLSDAPVHHVYPIPREVVHPYPPRCCHVS